MGLTPNAMQRISGASFEGRMPRCQSFASSQLPLGNSPNSWRRLSSRSRETGREANRDLKDPSSGFRQATNQRHVELDPQRVIRVGALSSRGTLSREGRCGNNSGEDIPASNDGDDMPAPNEGYSEPGSLDAGVVPITPSLSMKPRVPHDVSNTYNICAMLGSGGFGTVWMAQRRGTSERVAIKIVERKRQLYEDFSLEPAEAEILKNIDHPCIVKLIDYISSEVYVYLVMELVLGGHLQAKLKTKGAYPEKCAKCLLQQVISAVHHLHDRNIIHRDIKPENLLFDEGEELRIKLTDFGLSTQKEGRLHTRCGTPSYCAPELLSGEGYGKAVDMWSLGVLTYVILTGNLPFIGSDRADLFRRIQKGCYGYGDGAPIPSACARDFISRLLKIGPIGRYSTREAVNHPWFSDETSADGGSAPIDSLNTVHEMVRKFNAERRLKRLFHVVFACGRFRRAGLGWPTAPGESEQDYLDYDVREHSSFVPACGMEPALASDEEPCVVLGQKPFLLRDHSPEMMRPNRIASRFTLEHPGL